MAGRGRGRETKLGFFIVPAWPRAVRIFVAPANTAVPRIVWVATAAPCATAVAGEILVCAFAGSCVFVPSACGPLIPQFIDLVFDPFYGTGRARGRVVGS